MATKRTRAAGPDALAFSRFARRAVAADPSLASEVSALAGEPWSRKEMRQYLAGAAGEEGALRSRLRRLRRGVFLRTMARDLSGRADLGEVCATMTALADVCVDAVQSLLEREFEAQLGRPLCEGRAQRLIVVGMGKLGGGELNVSSDIDLILVYPEEGETVGARALSHHEYFVRMGQRLIRLLDEPTEEGRVFRVDMRLRPWGDSGPLAVSFDGLEQYLVAHGREWERYAWIKARAMTGARGGDLAAIVRPFVYRKYLDFGAFAAMRELHAEIRAEVMRRELADHIKLGPGGIREIEFIAQVFQLIRGGREANLQVRPTLQVLALLGQKRLLPESAVAELRQAYVFLRRLEHRLQYLEDAQTHLLPQSAEDRGSVAWAMGYSDWEAFLAALEAHRSAVSSQFEQVFATDAKPRHAFASLWSGEGETGKRLASLGFRDPESVTARLAAVRSSTRYADLPGPSRERFDALVPRLLEESAKHGNPDQVLSRCLALIETVSRRAAYLALLDEHPQALAKLAEVVGLSSWAAEYLNRHPIVLDELLDARLLLAEPDWSEFGAQLRRSLIDTKGDAERQMDVLREAHHAQVFRLLTKDVAGLLTVERLADHLSDLADLMLQATLELCWTVLRARHREFPDFAVVGYGKLGGKELGYASDLDIIFLYEDEHEAAPEVYARLAQRINLWLTTRTGAGVLFETDLRLRPDGASGLMVSSMEAFRRYQRESAWVWEHQALTRARFCAGDATVGAAFEEERRRVLRAARDPGKLRDEVLEMRRTMLEGHPNPSGLFDIKHDRGGMVDIEFMVQYLVLAHAHAHAELVRNDGNIALLKYAAALGLIPGGPAERVGDAYRDYRRRQHALRLNGAQYARVPPQEFDAQIAATLELWRLVFGERAV
ncbi:MAG: bifunctional glutamine synthetase adenylyltransferase/deadenyltransferase [Betaproteobacteria bacterium RIFCSPLOWO2_02_FULL_64_12]|nr:MAG: bifunctional glutamine synthetase adenylyltransferase/deadenyltransferase [Betaproteobacteria bacterium RIFCSPLOWO2_02_FULL_64_12]